MRRVSDAPAAFARLYLSCPVRGRKEEVKIHDGVEVTTVE